MELTLLNGMLFLEGRWIKGSIVIEDGVIREVGKDVKPRGETWDLKGRPVIPGLVDSHIHLLSTATMSNMVDLKGVRSLGELKKRLAEACRSRRVSVIIGRGWDQELFEERRYPKVEDLDEACPTKPIIIVRVCGHVAVANSLALKALGLARKDGLLLENEVEEALKRVFKPNWEELLLSLRDLLFELPRRGVTMVHAVSSTPEELKALQELKLRWGLPVRVRVYLEADCLDLLEKLGLMGDLGDEVLKIKGIKAFVDGSLGARTAYLSEEYNDGGGRGRLLLDAGALSKLISRARALNLQVAVHAIGDAAVAEALKGMRKARVRGPWVRIEHCSLVPPHLLKELGEERPVITVQPHFVISDWWAVKRLGERCRWLYPFKSLMKRGLTISGSSDSPVEPWDPWTGIYAAVDRGGVEGLDIFKYTKCEMLSLEEALTTYTAGGAKACMEYPRYGSLRKGSAADVVVLESLPDRPEDLKNVEIYATFVNGRPVYFKEEGGTLGVTAGGMAGRDKFFI